MLRRVALGATISGVGVGTTLVGVKLAEQNGVLQKPSLSAPVLVFISSGYVAMGAASVFYASCEEALLGRGFVRGMVLQSYAQKTTWASKPTVRGEDLEPIVKSMMRTDPFIKLTALQQETGNALNQATYGLVRQSDVYEALMREVGPFARSEKVVADRLRDTLVEAAEQAVRRSIATQRDGFIVAMATSMFLASLITLALDRAFPPTQPRRASRLAERFRQHPKQQNDHQAEA
ncbi:Hypothetical Protein FCC1311_055962 [Hondaea fermentalgiana]|uniref:Uncharacterized protein n=1 Tax=Hondaea fermentalgiana TaxID=2315210 RepID=A0A2R5GND2_9STRA|nr:Hypothetical Protein FCC1311_055962 [Hondaea fermentalgiana]|eukprot:GBG29374.1 Hypothetical Protein FCC1311_055962 [Hondaea fermentalgiana]